MKYFTNDLRIGKKRGLESNFEFPRGQLENNVLLDFFCLDTSARCNGRIH